MKAPVPSRRAVAVLAWVGAVVAALLFAWLVARVLDLSHDNQVLAERDRESIVDRRELEQRQVEQEAASVALAEQLRQLGEKPAVEPSDPPSPGQVVIVPGPKGDRGESCIEQIGYPRCRGAAGDDGTSGIPGEAGQDGADGAPGPKGDKGDPGVDGKDGTNGTDGRGIANLQCGDGGRWTVTYTDGTTADAGLCRVAPGNSGEKR